MASPVLRFYYPFDFTYRSHLVLLKKPLLPLYVRKLIVSLESSCGSLKVALGVLSRTVSGSTSDQTVLFADTEIKRKGPSGPFFRDGVLLPEFLTVFDVLDSSVYFLSWLGAAILASFSGKFQSKGTIWMLENNTVVCHLSTGSLIQPPAEPVVAKTAGGRNKLPDNDSEVLAPGTHVGPGIAHAQRALKMWVR
ncbi:hypothetical protein H920_18874 [Fukomys damarensis]|uniref:Uncharacterized protein n=1 Tax=Fukomys damarensis TaxID=885580 RepID=A0A091DAA9_FUKDA|nr:hypothetical protein H920_18874 [Fukomys damarensis]